MLAEPPSTLGCTLRSVIWTRRYVARRAPRRASAYTSGVPGGLLSSCACARDESTQRDVDVWDRRSCSRDPRSESPRLPLATGAAAHRAGSRCPERGLPVPRRVRRPGRLSAGSVQVDGVVEPDTD